MHNVIMLGPSMPYFPKIYNKEWLWDCEEDKTKSGKRKEERILTEND